MESLLINTLTLLGQNLRNFVAMLIFATIEAESLAPADRFH